MSSFLSLTSSSQRSKLFADPLSRDSKATNLYNVKGRYQMAPAFFISDHCCLIVRVHMIQTPTVLKRMTSDTYGIFYPRNSGPKLSGRSSASVYSL